jgi:2,3-bisphosphoglycerate-independent phosphoglycerate mutase
LKQISIQSESKIVLLVIDGLGGLPDSETGRTELETAEPWKTFTGRLTK